MNFKKIFYITFFLTIYLLVIYPSNRVPAIIKSQDTIFEKISKDINSNLPNNIEILIYKLTLLNGSEEVEKKINQKFNEIVSVLQKVNNYSIIFEKDIIEKYKNNKEINISFLENQDELELIGFGKLLNQDAVMISSVTIIEGKTKKVWDKVSHKFIDKKIALIQGNIFNTKNNNSILRFSYYFYLEE